MKEAVWSLVGLIGGFALSTIWWYAVSHVWAPRLGFSDKISVLPDATSRSTYRVKVMNTGKRGVIDLSVDTRICYPGVSVYPGLDVPTIMFPLRVPVPNAKAMRLGPGEAWFFRLRMDELLEPDNSDTKAILATLYPVEAQRQGLTFEAMLKRSEGAYLQLRVLCYDQWSGARKYYESQPYKITDIVHGRFDGLEVVPFSADAGS
ncbi:hypothetical protein FKR81_34690 [Lentzea tibetensis]|uniref:Uncharacterized protein n=1 Tax=Lentzea tibetensis TaxID=2591470 RepID=A0A563EIS7_9PSEU|nr:hypothetical protein [Lentzea tibetensis]TWP46735.1 hypothetical protein FKR81_34690 [Lentzea tibetensis]